jgi:hypothetical protein
VCVRCVDAPIPHLAGASRCPVNTYGAVGSVTCSACSPGTFCPAGAVIPSSCPVGFFCPAADNVLDALPRVCPAGSYCNTTSLGARYDHTHIVSPQRGLNFNTRNSHEHYSTKHAPHCMMTCLDLCWLVRTAVFLVSRAVPIAWSVKRLCQLACGAL